MVAGETLDDRTGELGLAVEEDALVRNEHVVEYGEGFVTAVAGIAEVDGGLLELARVAVLTTVDVVMPWAFSGWL